MINILYLIDSIDTPNAGTEKQLMRTIRLLDRDRFECSLMTLSSTTWLRDTELPCDWDNLRSGPLLRPGMVSAARRFVRVCRRRRIQILQTFFADSNAIGPFLGRLANVPVIIGSRRNIGYATSWKEYLALRLGAHFTTHLIANSVAAASMAIRSEGFDPSRISVIPNMLNVADFERLPAEAIRQIRERWGFRADALVVGAAANLRRVKNLHLLVGAAQSVLPHFPNARFVVLGEGPDRPRLEGLIDQAGLRNAFALPGSSNNVPGDVQAMDVCALVSSSESSPNALLEYMAAGKASVVSNVGGVQEVSTDGETALHFAEGDQDELAGALTRLLGDPELRTRMGIRAREHVLSAHNERQVMRTLEELYARLLTEALSASEL